MFTQQAATAAGAGMPGMGMGGGTAALFGSGASGIPAAPALVGSGSAPGMNPMMKRIAMQGMKQLAQPPQEQQRAAPPPRASPQQGPTAAEIFKRPQAPSFGMGQMSELERERLRLLGMGA